MKRRSKPEALVALVVMAALTSACPWMEPSARQGPVSPRWAGQCTVPAPGCLYLENHESAAVYMVRAGEKAGPANLVPPRSGSVPGRSHLMLDPARDVTAVFTLFSGQAALAGTVCSLGGQAWERRNPVLAWRDGALRCEGGR